MKQTSIYEQKSTQILAIAAVFGFMFWSKIEKFILLFQGKITFVQFVNYFIAYETFETAIWIIAISVPIFLMLCILHFMRLRKLAEQELDWIRILPARDVRLDKERVEKLITAFGQMGRRRWTFFKGKTWFRLRFAIPQGSNQIAIYLAFPFVKENTVKDTIRSIYPSCEIHDVAKEEVPGPCDGGAGGHFYYRGKKGLPLASFHEKKSSAIASILLTMRSGSFLDVQFAPTGWGALEDRSEREVEKLHDKKIKDLSPKEKARRQSILKRLTGKEESFLVRLTIYSNHQAAKSVISSMTNQILTEMKHHGQLRFFMCRKSLMREPSPMPLPIPRTIMTWSGDELANFFHLPPGDHRIYNEPKSNEDRGYLVALSENQRTLEEWELSQGVKVGKMKHPIFERDIRIDFEQLTKHFVLTGAPGMGKSSLMIEMIQSILEMWVKEPDRTPGFTYIDPARETIAIILNRLRHMKQQGIPIPEDKIHYFPITSDATHAIGLNLLHKTAGVPLNEVAESAAEVILSTVPNSESLSRTKRLLSMAIQTLLEDEQIHTILGIEELFRNEQFRNRVIAKVKDPYVQRFWKNVQLQDKEFKEEVEPILNRLDPLLKNPAMRRLYCQLEWALDVRRYMDEGHIVLIDILGLNPFHVKTTVGHLIHVYHNTAKQRPIGSKIHLMMIDEAHLVQVPVLAKIIAEDRKFNFGLGLITQEIEQFTDSKLKHAIKSSMGTILSCAQMTGAKNVEEITSGHLEMSFLTRLRERNAAVFTRSKKDGQSTITTCVVQNEPPYVYLPDGRIANYLNREKGEAQEWGLEWGRELLANSKEAKSVEEVDRFIEEYMKNPVPTIRQVAEQQAQKEKTQKMMPIADY